MLLPGGVRVLKMAPPQHPSVGLLNLRADPMGFRLVFWGANVGSHEGRSLYLRPARLDLLPGTDLTVLGEVGGSCGS